MTTLLAGDIGGTKTSLAIVTSQRGPRDPLLEATFPSRDFPDLQTLVRQFLEQVDVPLDRAVFGVAGPVINGRVTVTNLPWVMSEEQLAADLHLDSVRLLNDLLSIANAVPSLLPEDIYTLNSGAAAPGGAMAVVAPGTGLGEAYLTWDGHRYLAQPSEGGHADFAPTSALELDLLQYLLERHDHVSYELVCSGMGLPNIYAFLRDRGHAEEPEWLRAELASGKDATAVIVNTALKNDPPSTLCSMTLTMFVSILGAETGNMALKVLATGGVYLGGGIPPRILSALQHGPFFSQFRSKGRFADAMDHLPVHVILNPKSALLGAATFGLQAR